MRSFITVFSLALCLACILTPQLAIAQQVKELCGTMEYLEKQKKADPTLEARMQLQEELLQQRLADMKKSKIYSLEKGKPGTPPPPPPTPPPIQSITIPVVVHILYNTPEQDFTNQQVIDQIAITNRDYAGLNLHSMGTFPDGMKDNTHIQFCLAQKKIDGSPTTGIERRQTSVTAFPTDNSMKYYSSGGLDAWDPTVYMNIWVVNLLDYGGYAQFPTSGINMLYGVVVKYTYFSPTDTTAYAGCGMVTGHELGHCLNLRHVWGDDDVACTGTDYCDDTPNQAGNSRFMDLSSIPTTGLVTDACSPVAPGIMYQNFMDYTWDIKTANFTPDQTLRMQALFVAPSGLLVPLLSSTAGSPPTSCEIPTLLRTIALTKTTASIAWTDMYNNFSGYTIRYKKTSVSTWTTTTSGTNSKILTGLTKNTNYEFQVQNNCSGGGSGYSASKFFKTPNTGAAKSGVFEEPSAPTELTIAPNPVADISTIYYTLTEPGKSSITIVNALGAEVVRLSSGQLQDPGTYSMQYDASRLIPGLYFVRFTTGRTVETTKFVIQR
ncbi:MAG: M43 family zinc metalloprotease [Bacteroidota bacterium]